MADETPTNMFQQLFQVVKALPTSKKISFAFLLCLLIGGFAALIFWTNRPDYQVLFANLDTADASRITEKLQEKRIPYELREGGSAVMVPSENVYQLRLDLASEGLPRGSSVGFEIFDKLPVITTEFVQKLKYQQALEGELARTINTFDAIDRARVHIVTSSETLFVKPEKEATASVVLRMKSGMTLEQNQLQGIINLVACAVEGLKPENVTVVDMAGGLLSKGQGEDSIGTLSQTQFEYQRRLERSLEKRVQTMLEPVVGINKVVARISAEVDFRQVNISEKSFDPDSQVIRSEQRQTELTRGSSSTAAGSPDAKYQIYQTQGAIGGMANDYQRDNSTINYDINEVNRQISGSVGDIKRLSAAVIIDGPYVSETDAEGNTSQKFVPRSRKEMKTFEEIVKKAIGFDTARGDQVSVTNTPFAIREAEIITDEEPSSNMLDYIRKAGKPIFNVILVLVFFVLAIRPFRRWLNQASEYIGPQALSSGADVPKLDMPTHEMIQRQESKKKLLEATKENPDLAAEVIRNWITEVR